LPADDIEGFRTSGPAGDLPGIGHAPCGHAHPHDAKTQYAKVIDDMDQWGGTISITLAGLFWVKDNNGSNAIPASVRQIPGNDMVYVKEKLEDRILFVPGAFTIPKDGIWWGVDEIKTFKEQGGIIRRIETHKMSDLIDVALIFCSQPIRERCRTR
jgi:hypothetical protein